MEKVEGKGDELGATIEMTRPSNISPFRQKGSSNECFTGFA